MLIATLYTVQSKVCMYAMYNPVTLFFTIDHGLEVIAGTATQGGGPILEAHVDTEGHVPEPPESEEDPTLEAHTVGGGPIPGAHTGRGGPIPGAHTGAGVLTHKALIVGGHYQEVGALDIAEQIHQLIQRLIKLKTEDHPLHPVLVLRVVKLLVNRRGSHIQNLSPNLVPGAQNKVGLTPVPDIALQMSQRNQLRTNKPSMRIYNMYVVYILVVECLAMISYLC